jgi:Domain of unknown function (DUF1918)
MKEKTATIAMAPGDLVVVDGHRVGESGRTGEILEVIGEHGNEHLRVLWEDGHESVLYSTSDLVIRRRGKR